MTKQFDRDVRVKVDTLDVSALDVSFRVIKTLKKEPNTCELTIYNLGRDNREKLGQLKAPAVEIRAGYKGRKPTDAIDAAVGSALSALDAGADEHAGIGTIYLGDLRDSHSNYEPPDWVTTIESGDGERASRFSRINKSFTAGTTLAVVMQQVSQSMGVGIGNAAQMAAQGNLLDAGKAFLNSVTLSGPASKELDRITKSAGLEWSVQDGALQLLNPGSPIADTSIVLADDSGLVGSPQIGSDGVIKLRSLLNPGIVPGRQLEVTSKVLSSQNVGGSLADSAASAVGIGGGTPKGTARFRAERVEYVGSNFDRDFYCDVEAREL
jgi:hypothetical protein